MQKPGIPAQQMQRTGTRERACGSRTGQNPLAEHAHTHTHKQQHRACTQPGHTIIPASLQKLGIPAQQMQRTGTRERACRSGTGQNPLAEHAHHAPQPRSIAWGGGGEAAMKGGAPCFLERASFL